MNEYNHSVYNYVKIIEIPKDDISKIDFAKCNEPRETLLSFYNRQEQKPDLLMNAGFFNMSNGETVFNYINEGKVIQSHSLYKWGMGVRGNSELKYGNMNELGWRDFISGYPNLIDNGTVVEIDYSKEINYNARRSVVGYNDTYIFLVTVELPGLNFKKLQEVLLDIGVKYAINLDGGGSTRLLKNGKCITSGTEDRAVDNVLAIYLKQETATIPQEPILYRVQLGAFLKKENADKYLKEIRSLGGIYENSYVKFVNPYYKVQCGAFSNAKNAESLLNDIKKRGYNAMIV